MRVDFETPNVYMSYNKGFFLMATLRYDRHGPGNTLHCRGPKRGHTVCTSCEWGDVPIKRNFNMIAAH
jgi:hypothetical protein